MKLLPCRPPAIEGIAANADCVARGFATLPNGKPYLMGRTPDDIGRRPFTYRCAHCKRATTLAAADWNGLPPASLAELRELGLDELVTKDLKGAGVTDEQIEQLEAAGVDWASLHRQEVREVPLSAWHSKGSKVFHDSRACTTGNNLEPENVVAGDGGLKRCKECARLVS